MRQNSKNFQSRHTQKEYGIHEVLNNNTELITRTGVTISKYLVLKKNLDANYMKASRLHFYAESILHSMQMQIYL